MANGPNPLEVAAANGEKMPQGLSLPEQFIFQTLRAMYSAYRAGRISKEQAREEKMQLVQSYRNLQLWCRIYFETAQMWLHISSALAEVNIHGCEYCRRVSRIFDGREPPPRVMEAINYGEK